MLTPRMATSAIRGAPRRTSAFDQHVWRAGD